MINRFNRWLLAVLVVIAVPFWWLLIDNDHGEAPTKRIHVADLRALAARIPGQRPTALTYTLVASRHAVGDIFAAGIGLQRRALAMITWTLPVPGKGPIVIDPGAPPDEAGAGFFQNLDRAKLSRIEAETRIASLVLHTHGHLAPAPASRGAARFHYFIGGKSGMAAFGGQGAAMASAQPAAFATAQAVAPGVVIIPTPGHAPDTRLIYVQLDNGREFLFSGNIATLVENWTELRIRSHLGALWGPRQNSAETYAWLRTIRQLSLEAPHMIIVPGHDYQWLTGQLGDHTVQQWQPARAPTGQGKPG